MTCMAAGMNDQAVKPNPVSFPRIPGSTVLCYRPNAFPTQKCARIGGTAYTELLAKQEDPFLRL